MSASKHAITLLVYESDETGWGTRYEDFAIPRRGIKKASRSVAGVGE